jgi:hypothetical protein
MVSIRRITSNDLSNFFWIGSESYILIANRFSPRASVAWIFVLLFAPMMVRLVLSVHSAVSNSPGCRIHLVVERQGT